MRNVRSTGPLWAVKTGYIVVSALFCVLGVVLFITAERCVPWIGRALGIGMVICGAIKLGGYFSKDHLRGGGSLYLDRFDALERQFFGPDARAQQCHRTEDGQ